MHRETIDLLKSWTTWLGVIASLIIGLVALFVTIFGYLKPKEDQKRLREQTTEQIRMELSGEKRNLENFSLALANLAQGNIALVQARSGPSLSESTQDDTSMAIAEADQLRVAFECFTLGLYQLTSITTGYNTLESIYQHALQGILNSTATDSSAYDSQRIQLAIRAIEFLEGDQVWSRHPQVSTLTRQVKKRLLSIATSANP